jgi:urease accessory protein UreF
MNTRIPSVRNEMPNFRSFAKKGETALITRSSRPQPSAPIALETLADEGALRPDTVEEFLRDYLDENGGLEAAFVQWAWTCDQHRDLSDELSARKLARESREASLKLGRRFAELVNGLADGPLIETGLHYCVAFGAAGAAFGIPERAVVLA